MLNLNIIFFIIIIFIPNIQYIIPIFLFSQLLFDICLEIENK